MHDKELGAPKFLDFFISFFPLNIQKITKFHEKRKLIMVMVVIMCIIIVPVSVPAKAKSSRQRGSFSRDECVRGWYGACATYLNPKVFKFSSWALLRALFTFTVDTLRELSLRRYCRFFFFYATELYSKKQKTPSKESKHKLCRSREVKVTTAEN